MSVTEPTEECTLKLLFTQSPHEKQNTHTRNQRKLMSRDFVMHLGYTGGPILAHAPCLWSQDNSFYYNFAFLPKLHLS